MTEQDTKTILEQNIEQVILALAPKFEITPKMLATFFKPQFEVSEGPIREKPLVTAMYDPINIKFTFRQDFVNNITALGHEVGHYFHDMVNETFQRDIFDSIERGVRTPAYWLGIQTKEMVGRYSEIVYSGMHGLPFSPWPKGDHIDNGSSGGALHDLAVELGYRRADRAFVQYDDAFLPQLVRMSLDEAVKDFHENFR